MKREKPKQLMEFYKEVPIPGNDLMTFLQVDIPAYATDLNGDPTDQYLSWLKQTCLANNSDNQEYYAFLCYYGFVHSPQKLKYFYWLRENFYNHDEMHWQKFLSESQKKHIDNVYGNDNRLPIAGATEIDSRTDNYAFPTNHTQNAQEVKAESNSIKTNNHWEIPADQNEDILKPSVPNGTLSQKQLEQTAIKESSKSQRPVDCDVILKNKDSISQIAVKPNSVFNRNKKDAISSLDAAKRMTSIYSLRNFQGKTYIYSHSYFHPIEDDELNDLIMEACFDLIEKNGRPIIVSDVHRFISMWPKLRIKEADIKRNYIAFRNGIVNIESGQFIEPSPNYFITFALQCDFNPSDTSCPNFQHLLNLIFKDDNQAKTRFWEILGYCFTPDTRAKQIFVFQGVSNSGKSLLIEILGRFFSDNQKISLRIPDLEGNFTLSDLIGKHLYIFTELPPDALKSNAISALKTLSGNDLTSSDVKYKARQKFRCEASILCTTNYPIYTKGREDALFKRLVALPFNHSIDGLVPNDITKRIIPEMTGIASVALQHYSALKARGYHFSGEYRVNENVEGTRMDETPTTFAELYNFTVNHIVEDETSKLFVEDAVELFKSEYHEISAKALSEGLCETMANLNYNFTKKKCRKNSGEYPKSCFEGVCLSIERRER